MASWEEKEALRHREVLEREKHKLDMRRWEEEMKAAAQRAEMEKSAKYGGPRLGEIQEDLATMERYMWTGSGWEKMSGAGVYIEAGDRMEGGWHNAKPAPMPEPAIAHKANHFPIEWMIEASERAEASDHMITIQLEKDGVVVIGQTGDDYETHTLPWAMMDTAPVNPIILGIETVERHLATLGRLKVRVAKR